LFSMTRFFKFLPGEQRQAFLGGLGAEGVMNSRAWTPALATGGQTT